MKRAAEDLHVWDTRDVLRSSERENEEPRQADRALNIKKECEELKKANKELWRRVEELQEENQKLQQQQQMSAEGIV